MLYLQPTEASYITFPMSASKAGSTFATFSGLSLFCDTVQTLGRQVRHHLLWTSFVYFMAILFLSTGREESFTSAFHLLRSRLCPYFYLCTHQFTVLFCGGIRSQSDMLAMVTPTTRGFREQLQKEGM